MTFAFSALGRNFAYRYVKVILIVIVAVALLVYTLEMFELFRRAGKTPGVSTPILFYLAAMRMPDILEQVLPFALLFAAIVTFLDLSRKLELVVARSAGISAWQIISPALLVALVIGILATTVINPMVSMMKERAADLDVSIFSKRSAASEQEGFWLRQRNAQGDAVINADRLQGTKMMNVSAFLFDLDGQFKARVEAETAELSSLAWVFRNVKTVTPGEEVKRSDEFRLATTISESDLFALAGRKLNASFWSLPEVIKRLELAGLSATRYRLNLQSLYSKPFFFMAMVLIAASVSLRFFRMGGVARMIGFGVIGGFSLYVFNQIGQDLGAAGILPVVAAAWAPALVGALAATQALLRLEDG